MSIEDVDYLLQNSVPDNLTFFIDSSHRDLSVSPEPNSFQVNFTETLRNVYGFEILDATIPVTMYTIDTFNNKLAYSHIFYFNDVNNTQFKMYFGELESNEVFSTVFNATANANIFVCLDMTNYDTIIASLLNPIDTYSQNVILGRQIFPIQVFNGTIFATNGTNFLSNGTSYYVLDASPELIAVLQSETQEFDVLSDLSGIVIYNYTYITDTDANIIVGTLSDIPSTVDFYINNVYFEIEPGSYDISTYLAYLTSILFNIRQSQISLNLVNDQINIKQTSTYGTVDKQSKFAFNFPGSNNCFLFDMMKSTCNYTMGFYGKANNYASTDYNVLSLKTNHFLFMSTTVTDSTGTYQYMKAPGIVNLQGMRYILLRIPEIESHAFNSFGLAWNSPGVGLFKLTSTNDVAQLRFDFINLIKKPFHPIGKLSKITLNFTMSDGTLYDFKGVDFQVLISIKYYAPKNKNEKDTNQIRSILNPNYNPDYLSYITEIPEKKDKRQFSKKDVLLEQAKYDYDRRLVE